MKMFKGKIDVGKAFDTIASGVDKIAFTEEERADFNKGVADAQLEFVKTTVSENSARSITRRYLAIGIVGVFLFLILSSAVAAAFNGDYAAFLFELAKSLTTLVLMVATFFFGGYYANKFVSASKEKKSNQKTSKNENVN